jgi:uncharacterized protein (DUF1684 family)
MRIVFLKIRVIVSLCAPGYPVESVPYIFSRLKYFRNMCRFPLLTVSLHCALWYASLHPGNLQAQQHNTYAEQVGDWEAKRITALKSPAGWLNLAGLFWLEDGRNSMGSAKENTLVFPAGKFPAQAGYLEKRDGRVILHTTDTALKTDGTFQTGVVVFDTSMASSPVMAYGSLRWTIIRRGDKTGVRLRDLDHPVLQTFTSIDRFPADTTWRVTAVLKPRTASGRISIRNVLGQVNELHSPGTLHFSLHGKAYTLDALEEEGKLFVIFGDRTNGETTYPAGRFLYAQIPGKDGITELDFNLAFNPPCAFTPYATCPLPPPQNRLALMIQAGEKTVHLAAD